MTDVLKLPRRPSQIDKHIFRVCWMYDGRSAKHAPHRIYTHACVICGGKSQRIFITDTPCIVHSITKLMHDKTRVPAKLIILFCHFRRINMKFLVSNFEVILSRRIVYAGRHTAKLSDQRCAFIVASAVLHTPRTNGRAHISIFHICFV